MQPEIVPGTFPRGQQGAEAYLCHFRVPATMALLHLPQDVNVQQAFHFVPVLEWMPVCAFLPLQLSWFS